jgi:hypothetical protein
MSLKILTNNGVENTNIEAAVFNEFILSGKNAIVKNCLNECNIALPSSNSISVDTGEFIVKGHLIINESLLLFTLNNTPAEDINYQLVLQIIVDDLKNVSWDIFILPSSDLTTEDINKHSGKYEIELATFTYGQDGIIINLVKKLLPKFNYGIDLQLSETSENAIQNKAVTIELNNKVAKIEGKGLSTNDYTDTEKEKLAGVEDIVAEMIDEAKQDIDPIVEDTEGEELFIPNTPASDQMFDKLKIYNQSYQKKNLLPIKATITHNGVTFTSNGNGSYTANGTATSVSAINLLGGDGAPVKIVAGTYRVSGCPSTGSQSSYFVTGGIAPVSSTTTYKWFNDVGTGITITVAEGEKVWLRAQVASGVTVSSITFYPQLELGSVKTSFEAGDGGRFMPEAPSTIIDTPAERTVPSNSRNLFNLGVTADWTDGSTMNLSVVNNTIQGLISSGAATHEFNTIKFYQKTGYFQFKTTVGAKRLLMRLYDINNNNISNTITMSGWTYNAFYNALFIETNVYINVTNVNVSYIRFGFALAGTTGLTEILYDIQYQPITTTLTPYVPYEHSEVIYKRKDINGVEYAGRSAGAVYDYEDAETGKGYRLVKRVEIDNTKSWSMATVTNEIAATLVYFDGDNKWTSIDNTVPVKCNIATYQASSEIPYTCSSYKQSTRTQLKLRVPLSELNSLDSAGATAWAVNQINAHGNIIFLIPYGELSVPAPFDLHPDELAKIRKIKSYNGGTWLTSDSRIIFNAEKLIVGSTGSYVVLKDHSGNTLFPATVEDNIFMKDGKLLSEVFRTLQSPDGNLWDITISNTGIVSYVKRT